MRVTEDARVTAAAVLLGGIALLGVLAPWIAPYDPSENLGRVDASLVAPCGRFWLGTDPESRDVLSRLLYGSRVSLVTAAATSCAAACVGAAVGILAGAVGGTVDRVLMRVTDFLLSIPTVVLLLAASALLGKSQGLLIALLVVTGWMGTARLVRAEVRVLVGREFVLAAKGLGLPPWRVWWRHVLPHVLGPVTVSATLGLGSVLVAESTLSFLGFGVPDPVPSWGKMVAEGFHTLRNGWWVSTFPALAIAACVTAASLAGDALRERRRGDAP